MAKRHNLRASATSGVFIDPAQLANSQEWAAAPLNLGAVSQTAGNSASKEALRRLKDQAASLKQDALVPLLNRSLAALREDQYAKASDWAMKALNQDEHSGLGWYLLGIAKEKLGDFVSALKCYESAFHLLPEPDMVASDLGRLAYRMDMKDIAGQFFRICLAKDPGSSEVANNLACVLRDKQDYGEAIDVLRDALSLNRTDPLLWNTLGTVMSEQGDITNSVMFFEEALSQDPQFAKARYNLGNAKLMIGDIEGAYEACQSALKGRISLDESAMMRLALSTILICRGEIGAGWDAYEARLDPNFSDLTHFLVDRPRWTPDADVSGKSVLVIGEQGLGDEVLFANLIPDLIDEIGPDGKLYLAVEKRLVPLFQRSFPEAVVGGHATFRYDHRVVRAAPFVEDLSKIDLWVPLASLLTKYRRTVESFPKRSHFLSADPERVAYWREQLKAAPPGPKVGILWKSLKMDGARLRSFSPFEQWRAVLETPGVSFINMQYGDSAAEIAEAKALYGIEIWQPPGINLKDDLDDVAALSCALDLNLGFANATTNIAAACGAPMWQISIPGTWTRIGTDHMPWYPQARVFIPPAFKEWEPVMQEVSAALTEQFSLPSRQGAAR